MNATLNKQAHAVASQLFGAEAHTELRRLAEQRGFASWRDVPERDARAIVRDLQAAVTSGSELANTATPGLCTREQREKISAIRHHMNWSWTYIRKLVSEYGVTDWTQLTQAQADNLIQRLGQIKKGYQKREKRCEA